MPHILQLYTFLFLGGASSAANFLLHHSVVHDTGVELPVLSSCPLPGENRAGCEVAEEVVGDGSRLVAMAGENMVTCS